LYELLCRTPPKQGEDEEETRRRIEIGAAHSTRAHREDVPIDLDMVCMKCLASVPADRYQSASDLAADLRRFLAGKPVLARPISRTMQVWRWCRRRPIAATTATAAVFLVVGATIITTALWQRSEHFLSEAVVQRRAAIDSLQQSHATLVALNWALDESTFWSDSSDAFRSQLRSELSDYFQAVVHQHQSTQDRPTAISAAANSFLAQKALAAGDRDSALRHFSTSLDRWHSVLSRQPENGAYRRAMSLTLFAATTCLMQGTTENRVGEFDQGRFVEALSIDDPQDRLLLENYAELLCRRAASYLRLNRPADGVRATKASLRIWERLQNSHAKTEDYDYCIAHARRILGDNLARMRIVARAEEQYLAAETLLNARLRDQPGDPQIRLELALALHRSANLIRRARGPAAALPKYEAAAALLHALTAENAGNNDYRRCLADLSGSTAQAHLAAGDKEKAIAAFKLYRDASWPDYQRGALDLRSATALANACRRLAELFDEGGHVDSAITEYQRAIEIFENTMHVRPENTRLRNSQAECYRRLAKLQEGNGNAAAAEESRQLANALNAPSRIAPE
jgi:tetratricopeptide (TPR) repeat protein